MAEQYIKAWGRLGNQMESKKCIQKVENPDKATAKINLNSFGNKLVVES